MGSIAGVGIIPPEGVQMLVSGMNAGTSRPYHVNFITIFTSQAHIDLMCEMKPRAVSFSLGSSAEVLDRPDACRGHRCLGTGRLGRGRHRRGC
jgi:hypothetical protein